MQAGGSPGSGRVDQIIFVHLLLRRSPCNFFQLLFDILNESLSSIRIAPAANSDLDACLSGSPMESEQV